MFYIASINFTLFLFFKTLFLFFLTLVENKYDHAF